MEPSIQPSVTHYFPPSSISLIGFVSSFPFDRKIGMAPFSLYPDGIVGLKIRYSDIDRLFVIWVKENEVDTDKIGHGMSDHKKENETCN